MKYLINQNMFSLFYSKGQLLLSRLWVEYFSNQEKVRDGMWNFGSQDKHPSMKPKYFVALADLLSFLGGLLRDGGNGEFNQPGISDLRLCQFFFFVLNNCHSEIFQPTIASLSKLFHYLTLFTCWMINCIVSRAWSYSILFLGRKEVAKQLLPCTCHLKALRFCFVAVLWLCHFPTFLFSAFSLEGWELLCKTRILVHSVVFLGTSISVVCTQISWRILSRETFCRAGISQAVRTPVFSARSLCGA